jgi:2-aminoethylphosphonate-pyruvate transaminase
MILLNPGPVTLSFGVKRALSSQDLCHREPEFSTLLSELRRGIAGLYPDSNGCRAVLLSGSGTLAIEAMVSSFVPRKGTALVLSNGHYGERIARMLSVAGRPFEVVESAWDEPWNLEALSRRLRTGRPYNRILAVHHETTTGRLNDLEALGELSARWQVPILLDAVSSFGAELISMRKWNIAALAGVANKCLHGAPGLSFVLARHSELESENNVESLYMNLREHDQAQERGSTLFTLPTNLCLALAKALEELREEGGPAGRRSLYLSRFDAIEDAIALAGHLPLISEPAFRSSVLRAFRVRGGDTYERLHARLKKAGFILYAGQGRLSNEIFRVSLMGDIPDASLKKLAEEFRK